MTTEDRLGHTEGPWWVCGDPNQNYCIHSSTGSVGEVWRQMRATSDGAEELATARLIAAAPDLLAACQAFIALLEAGADLSHAEAAADLAIAKAVGNDD